ncbi:MAG: SynChlorMet cassette radical SAM/SPASM protein ScmF [Candidatus Riflebacteria bacterium]|nr:SynChlorMet cassette radical SAM/SPASM protein ScmF [Candidatus Riflebacteria bacterium]
MKSENQLYKLEKIYFYLTEGCNSKCRHCWLAPEYLASGKNGNQIDIQTVKKIVREAIPLGLKQVKLTGGEPLIHGQFPEIIEFLASEKIRIIIETNGFLLNEEITGILKGVENIFISVSLDSYESEIHDWVRGVPGSFDLVMAGIRRLIKAGIKPQLIMSVLRKNCTQLEQFVKLAENIGAHSVKFNVIMPTERGLQLTRSGETLSIHELIETGRYAEEKIIPQAGINVFFHHPIAFRPLKRLAERNNVMGKCGIKNIIGVLSDGSYALCGIGSLIPELIFGKATETELENIWNDSPMLNMIRSEVPSKLEGVCGKCIHNQLCLGSCIAQNYYSTRRITAPYWYCEDAFKAGLFPLTRLKPDYSNK